MGSIFSCCTKNDTSEPSDLNLRQALQDQNADQEAQRLLKWTIEKLQEVRPPKTLVKDYVLWRAQRRAQYIDRFNQASATLEQLRTPTEFNSEDNTDRTAANIETKISEQLKGCLDLLNEKKSGSIKDEFIIYFPVKADNNHNNDEVDLEAIKASMSNQELSCLELLTTH